MRFLVVLVVIAVPTLAAARPGTLVRSFGEGGMVIVETGPGAGDMALDVAVQSDGKIIAAGLTVVRYLPDGAVDTSFGTNGTVPLPVPQPAGWPYLAVLPGDAFLLALGIDGTSTVIRYASDGRLDPSFGTGGVVRTTLLPNVTALRVQPDGKILLAGGARLNVLRLEADGSVDVSFGTAGLASHPTAGDYTEGLALQPDGAIVVGAHVSSPDGGDWVLTRYDSTGQIDPSFGVGGLVTGDPLGGGNDIIRTIVYHPDGVVVVGRTIDAADEYWFVLVRYVNGVIDPTFGVLGVAQANFRHQGAGGNELPWDAFTDSTGNLVVVGRADTDREPFAMVRFEPNGTLDANFGTGGGVLTFSEQPIDAYAGAEAPDGTIILVGGAPIADEHRFAVARYAGAGSDLPRCPHTREFTCHDLPTGGTAALTMTNGHDDADKKDGLSWQWRGVVVSDFGDPTTTEGYALCVYKEDDEVWPPLRYAAPIPAAGLCRGKPCWKSTSGGFKHKSHDGSPGGVATLAVKQTNGETKIALKGRGANLGGMHLLPIAPPFVVQLRNTSGRCWSSAFTSARVNDRAKLKARANAQ
jgi:uncharacterized delta-60 repeat protein